MTLLSAKDLKDEDGAFNKSDAYFKFTVGGQEHKSNVDKGSDDPTYNEKFQIDTNGDSKMTIEAYDKDTTNKDDLLGKTTADVQEILQRLQ